MNGYNLPKVTGRIPLMVHQDLPATATGGAATIDGYVRDHLYATAAAATSVSGASVVSDLIAASPARGAIFFELVEVLFASGIADRINATPRVNVCAITSDCASMVELLDFVRGMAVYSSAHDTRHILKFDCAEVSHWCTNTAAAHKTAGIPVDLFLFDILDPALGHNCPHRALLVVCMVVRWQMYSGTCIIRMGGDTHRPTADLIFCMASMFANSVLVKPSVGDPLSSTRYLVCQNFRSDHVNAQALGKRVAIHLVPYAAGAHPIRSILEHPPPYFFAVKLEEFNTMVAQNQLDAADAAATMAATIPAAGGGGSPPAAVLAKWAAWCDKHRLPRAAGSGAAVAPFTGNIFTDAG